MRLIGGVMAADRAAREATIAFVTERAPNITVEHDRGPAGFFTTLGPETIELTGHVWTVGDLELTNVPELRTLTGIPEGRPGLLATLYALDGPRFVRRLRGGFALALWDRARQALVLAVDQVGIKRLYHVTQPGRVAFASRSSTLPVDDRGVDITAVYTYLNFGFVPAPQSILAGVHRLPPGYLLHVQGGTQRLERYWDIEYTERAVPARTAAAEIHRLAEDSVARALTGASGKTAGAFLSGGTDSSTVLGLASRLTGGEVSAFSIGFREPAYDELGYAALAARHFGVAHHMRIVSADDVLDALPAIVAEYDEPFGNNSAIGTFFCATLARDCGIARLLAGDGGDEIFGGNERYRVDRIFARYHGIPAAVRRGLLEPLLLGLPDGGPSLLGRAQRYIRRANLPNPQRLYSWEFFFAQQAADLLTPDFRRAVPSDTPWEIVGQHWRRPVAASDLNRQLYLDMKLAIGDNDLLKVMRTAELAGVDVRFPLLDLSLVESTATLPGHFKLRGLDKRYLFKRAFRSLLPAAILAKRKHGFGVPTSLWLKEPGRFRDHARDILLSPRFRQRGYFLRGAVERLLALHDADDSAYYGDLLWRALMLEQWHRHHRERFAARAA